MTKDRHLAISLLEFIVPALGFCHAKKFFVQLAKY